MPEMAHQCPLFNKDFFVQCHQGILGPTSISKLRSIFYPAIPENIKEQFTKDQIVRCGEHSDYGTITFLYQVNRY